LRRINISAKIFGIAVGLMLIMALAATFTARMSSVVSNQLRILDDHYMPAYVALGEVDAAAGDEAGWVRRLFIDDLEGQSGIAQDKPRIKAGIVHEGESLDQALATARELINKQIADPSGFDDDVALGRLDTRLELLQEDRVSNAEYRAKVIDAVDRGDRQAFYALLPQFDRNREALVAKIDIARAEMERLARLAAEGTRAYQSRAVYLSSLLMLLAGAVGLAIAGVITQGLVRPVRRLLDGTAVIEGGMLDVNIPVTSRDEIGRLTESFNRMVVELRSKERIRATFGKYVDPRIVEGLLDRPELNRAEGERRVMTILFCDLKGFTSLSEGLTPTALVSVINRYLTLGSAPVREHGGIIDKYIGDAIMAFWGPPFCAAEDQGRRACFAALEQIEAVARLREELPELLGVKRNLPQMSVRIGIATGEVIVGDIGSDVTKSYTVMGDTVNLASRLEGASKIYGTRILINEQAAALAGEWVELREIDSILVVGKTEPQRVYEVLGRKGHVAAELLALRDRYVAGLEAYRRRDWDAARAEFAQCRVDDADDPAAAVFLERLEQIAAVPPCAEWNGVWTLTAK